MNINRKAQDFANILETETRISDWLIRESAKLIREQAKQIEMLEAECAALREQVK